MTYIKLNLEQGSPEWIKARYNYVTASQVPVLFDLSPYQTRLGLFEEKVLQRETLATDGKEVLFARGHNAERAGREYLKKHRNIAFEPAVLVSKEHPELLASLDGHLEHERRIFEAKFVGKDALADIRAGKIPPHHLCQVQAAMLVSDAVQCLYFASDPNGDSHLAEITADKEYQRLIAEAAKKFWVHVQKGEPPEMSDRDFFQPESDARFEKLRNLDLRRKAIEAEFDDLRAELIEAYKTHTRVMSHGVSIIKSTKRGSIDYGKIPVLKGIDLEKFRKPSSEIVTVRFGKVGAN